MSFRGPLRIGVGEVLVDGRIHQVLACGHTVEAILDRDGLWAAEGRNCGQCRKELEDGHRQHEHLTDAQVLAAIGTGDWSRDMDDVERSRWVARAKRAWYYVRYGDKGVFREREGDKGGQEDPSHIQGP